MDVNFVGRNNFVTTLIEGILILGHILVILLIITGIPTITLMQIIIRCPLILNLILKSLLVRNRVSMLRLKKICLRLISWLGTWIEFLLMLIL